MNLLDVSSNPRLTHVVDLLHSLAGSADPRDVLEGLTSHLRCGGQPPAYAELTAGSNGKRDFTIRRLRTDDGRDLVGGSGPSEYTDVGGTIGRLIQSPQPRIIHDLDLSNDPVLPGEMAVYRSAMAAPLFLDDAGAHDWVFLFHRESQAFGVGDLEELIIRTSLVSAMSNNLRIARQLFESNLRVQKEISDIADIQRGLLPEHLPTIPNLAVAASYHSMSDAGGDMYDFVPLAQPENPDDPRWAILIGDVSGHGAPAAVVMAMLHSILHAFPHRPAGPAELLTHANRHLCAKRIGRSFTTGFLGVYDPANRTLCYARAGQTPPLLIPGSAPRDFRYLDTIGDLPLGINSDEQYTETTLQLRPGDALVLYTDGITECKNHRGEFFETAGLESALAAPLSPDPSALITRIRHSMLTHARGTPPSDDQTIVAMQVV
jgi:sigma-B regulation protein RsbU (phosphoserine phosphatase)